MTEESRALLKQTSVATQKANAGISDDQPDILKRVLVYDVICNIADKKDLNGKVYELPKDPEESLDYNPPVTRDILKKIESAPRNTVLGWEVAPGKPAIIGKKENNQNTVLGVYYPLFSSHVQLPVKPGEHVFVLNSGNRSYWLSRITEPEHIEDANYTHSDRRHIEPGPPASNESAVSKFRKPGFPNGNSQNSIDPNKKFDNEDLVIETERFIIDEVRGYDKIIENSSEKEQFSVEPVPRLTKRPGDFAIQGSHNTAIILGTDRGYSADDRPNEEKSNAAKKVSPGQGAIDLVVGRGRIFEAEKEGAPKDSNILTRPRVVKNTREQFETDKDATKDPNSGQSKNRKLDSAEGDPDFINDSARLYLSMKGDIDNKLGIKSSTIPRPIEGSISDITDDSSASIKADRIRIVARKTKTSFLNSNEPSDVRTINGDIRIIKQGEKASDSAVFYMMNNGVVQLSGKKIFLGRSEDQTSSDYGGSGPGPGGTQPYVRFSDLKKLFEETFSAIDIFCTTLLGHRTPGGGNPSPQILAAAQKLQTDLSTIKTSVGNFDKLKSDRIFGE